MKKIITVLAALAVTTAAAFAAPTISVGGGFGAEIEQQLENNETSTHDGLGSTTDIVASPVFSIKGDFQWEKLGVAVDFDFNLNEKSSWDNGIVTVETLYVNPYVNLNAGDFNFNIGPVVGMRFFQDVDNNVSKNFTFLLFGGSVNSNYKITDKLSVYLELPVLFNNMLVAGTTKEGGTTDKEEFNIYRARLEVVPKMGVTFTF